MLVRVRGSRECAGGRIWRTDNVYVSLNLAPCQHLFLMADCHQLRLPMKTFEVVSGDETFSIQTLHARKINFDLRFNGKINIFEYFKDSRTIKPMF